MDAGERAIGADLGADRRELAQADRGIDRIGGARPAAAELDHRKPDRAHVDLFDEAGRPRRRVDEDRGARQKLMRTRR